MVTKLSISCVIPIIVSSPETATAWLKVQLAVSLNVPLIAGLLQSYSDNPDVLGVVCEDAASAE